MDVRRWRYLRKVDTKQCRVTSIDNKIRIVARLIRSRQMHFKHHLKLKLLRLLYAPERFLRSLLEETQCGYKKVPGILPTRLHIYGKKVYSQNDEDGIIEHIFSTIGYTNRTFVEIGVGPPRDGSAVDETTSLECNCRLLAEQGWTGVYFDAGDYPEHLGMTREFITAENINDVLEKHKVPEHLDLLSIDIDGNDYWIWQALRREPRVVVIEYNSSLGFDESKTIPYDPSFDWAAGGCTKYYGASLLALTRLGARKDYTLVYANTVNAFFVSTDFLQNFCAFDYDDIYRGRDRHGPFRGDEVWVEVL